MSAMTFKCGACGTEVTGLRTEMAVSIFAEEHAMVCPGYPPAVPAFVCDVDESGGQK